MAICHFSVKVISRGTGSSAVISAAYRHATKSRSNLLSMSRDYSAKQDELKHSEVSLGEDAPAWAKDAFGNAAFDAALSKHIDTLVGDMDEGHPDYAAAVEAATRAAWADVSRALWNSVEWHEHRVNNKPHAAQLSRSLTLALPRELGHEVQLELLRGYVGSAFTSRGMIADWVIHDKGDGNPHAHVMVTMRDMGEENWGNKNRDWNDRGVLLEWRKVWADHVNLLLEREGFTQRIDHRSLVDQGIELEVEGYNPHIADHAQKSGAVAVEKLRCQAVIERNRAYLRANPDHILVVVQARQTMFSEEDVQKALADRLGLGVEDEEVVDLSGRAMASDDLVVLEVTGEKDETLYVTRAQAQVQQNLAAYSRGLAAKVLDHEWVSGGELNAGLNAGQRAAADAMLDRQRLTLVRGVAGAGKTFTLSDVSRIWAERGYEVLGSALSGKAVSELAGIEDMNSATLAAWEARWSRGERPSRQFIFVMDEAGMVGAGQWHRIQRQVEEMGGKFIAIGDPEQLQPVADVAGWYAAERGVGRVSVIDEVVRQEDFGDREATKSLARGGADIVAGIDHYIGKGSLQLEETAFASYALADAYWDAGNAQESRLALAVSNRDVWELNDAIREEGLERGILNAGETRQYGSIERILRKGGEVERFEVPLVLGEGERIIMTRALREADIARGSFGTVVAVREKEIDVVFDGMDRVVTLGEEQLRGVDYGYAATIHKAQGVTVDHAFLLGHMRLHRHGVYVALSRHRKSVQVFGRKGQLVKESDLRRLAQVPGHLDVGLADHDDPLHGSSVTDVANMSVASRQDWLGDGVGDGGSHTRYESRFLGDDLLMGVGKRVSGLLSADYADGDPVLQSDLSEQQAGYVYEPQRVIDDLIGHSSVLTADDVAERLSKVAAEPDLFLRLFREAMAHDDLVVLGEYGPQGRLYTTGTQLEQELNAVDCGLRLSLTSSPPISPQGAPTRGYDALVSKGHLGTKGASKLLNRGEGEEEPGADVLRGVLSPGRLKLVRGNGESPRAQVASRVGELGKQGGWQVIHVTPTASGLDGLRREGVKGAMTLNGFLSRSPSVEDIEATKEAAQRVGNGADGAAYDEGDATNDATNDAANDATMGRPPASGQKVHSPLHLDEGTMIVVGDIDRLGGKEATQLLERVEASGAKLVGFMGGEEQLPLGSGAVMRALELRTGSLRLDGDGVRSEHGRQILSGLVDTGEEQREAARHAVDVMFESGCVVAGGDKDRSIDVLAYEYLKDNHEDKIALTWSRRDVEAVTQAIRTQLDNDQTTGRAEFVVAGEGPLQGLKPHDRVVFTASSPWISPGSGISSGISPKERARLESENNGVGDGAETETQVPEHAPEHNRLPERIMAGTRAVVVGRVDALGADGSGEADTRMDDTRVGGTRMSGTRVGDTREARADQADADQGKGGLILRLEEDDGSHREIVVTDEMLDLPQWRFDFANTIHSSGGLVRESVHLLAGPGMSRQVLAAGVAVHRDRLNVVVPSSGLGASGLGGGSGTKKMLDAIAVRDAPARSVLDYGFDVSLGGRTALHGRSVEAPMEGLEASLGRLREIAGYDDPYRFVATPRGLDGEVMAEVIGASVLRHGSAPEGKDRTALEAHIRALGDPPSWRWIMWRAGRDLPQRSDELAHEAGCVDDKGSLLTPARILARGALSSRSLGEDNVAQLFEDGLALYSRRVSKARREGRLAELVAPQVGQQELERLHGGVSAQARHLEEEARKARYKGALRPDWDGRGINPNGYKPSSSRGRSWRWRLPPMDLYVSDEELARSTLSMFGIREPGSRRNRVKSYKRELVTVGSVMDAADGMNADNRLDVEAAPSSALQADVVADVTGSVSGANGAVEAEGESLAHTHADTLAAVPDVGGHQTGPETEQRPNGRAPSLNADIIRYALRGHAGALFRDAFGEPVKSDAIKWRAQKNTSITMSMETGSMETGSMEIDRYGTWRDFSAGTGGNLLDLVAMTRCDLPNAKADFPRVLREAMEYAGLTEDMAVDGSHQARLTYKMRKQDRITVQEAEKAQDHKDRDNKDMDHKDRAHTDRAHTDMDNKGAHKEQDNKDRQDKGVGLIDPTELSGDPSSGDVWIDVPIEEPWLESDAVDLHGGDEIDHHGLVQSGPSMGLEPFDQSGQPDQSGQADQPDMNQTVMNQPGTNQPGDRVKTQAQLESEKAPEPKKDEAERENEELVAALVARSKPIAIPSAFYLAARDININDVPDGSVGYLEPLSDLPDSMRKSIHNPDQAAFVVWARDDDGNIVGGQRILIDGRGNRVSAQSPLADHDGAGATRPFFGRIGGNPARFAMRDGLDAPSVSEDILVIAEGPETALSIRQATGYETWAVFDLSGWESASLPRDRKIILAPDRDGPDSPSGMAFAKFVEHHLEQGCDLWIAEAPEEEGSKRGLNDTARRAGYDVVRDTVESAVRADEWGVQPKHVPEQTQEQMPELTPEQLKELAEQRWAEEIAMLVKEGHFDGRALRLACAITQRVNSDSPVHRRNLVEDIKVYLAAAEKNRTQNGDETEARIGKYAHDLATARVTFDARMALGKEATANIQVEGEVNVFLEDVFRDKLSERAERDPPMRRHPLALNHPDIRRYYDARVEDRVKQALGSGVVPDESERDAARIIQLGEGLEQQDDLVDAMRNIFTQGSLQKTDDIEKGRPALLEEVIKIGESQSLPKGPEHVLNRLYGHFTHQEVYALSKPDKPLPPTLSGLDANQRKAIAGGLERITKRGTIGYGRFAWKEAGKALGQSLNPELSRSRGMSMGW